MTRTPLTLFALLVTSLALAGCADEYGTGPEDQSDDGFCGGTCQVASASVRVSGTVYDEAARLPIANAEVCAFLVADDGCARSDGGGRFQLDVTPGVLAGSSTDRAVMLIVRAADFAPTMHAFEPTSGMNEVEWDLGVLSTTELERLADQVGLSLRPDRGVIHISATGTLAADLGSSSVEGVAADGEEITWYADRDGELDPELGAMTESGKATEMGVLAGVRELTLSDAEGGAGCMPATGWLGERDGSVEVFVLPGFVSSISARCA